MAWVCAHTGAVAGSDRQEHIATVGVGDDLFIEGVIFGKGGSQAHIDDIRAQLGSIVNGGKEYRIGAHAVVAVDAKEDQLGLWCDAVKGGTVHGSATTSGGNP